MWSFRKQKCDTAQLTSLFDVTDRRVRAAAAARARFLVGPDGRSLSMEWLAHPDVYCVAQENETHGTHHEHSGLFDALLCFRGTQWCLAQVEQGRVTRLAEIVDPRTYLEVSKDRVLLPSGWTEKSFLLFNTQADAVILYSRSHKYRLVAGSAEFVRAYIDGEPENPIDDLRERAQTRVELHLKNGRVGEAEIVQHTLDTALSQVKIPPLST